MTLQELRNKIISFFMSHIVSSTYNSNRHVRVQHCMSKKKRIEEKNPPEVILMRAAAEDSINYSFFASEAFVKRSFADDIITLKFWPINRLRVRMAPLETFSQSMAEQIN